MAFFKSLEFVLEALNVPPVFPTDNTGCLKIYGRVHRVKMMRREVGEQNFIQVHVRECSDRADDDHARLREPVQLVETIFLTLIIFYDDNYYACACQL